MLLGEELRLEVKFSHRGGGGTGTGCDPGRGSHHLAQSLELGLDRWLVSVPRLRHVLTGEDHHE